MLSKAEVLRLAQSIHGWCTPEELEWIYEQAKLVTVAGLWVELGCFKGRSICPALFSGTNVMAVDTFAGHPASPTDFEGGLGRDWLLGHVRLLVSLAKKHNPKLRFSMIEQDSCSTAQEVKNKQPWFHVEAVWMDVDYREQEKMAKDIDSWKAVLAPSGILCGRNHGRGVEKSADVSTFIDWYLPERELMSAGSIWCWRKEE